jgi:glycosyltransferase 2 family protein
VLVFAGLVFVSVRLRSTWEDSHIELGRVGWAWLTGAVVVTACGVLATGFIWLEILERLGVRTQPRFAGIFFQAQLGKYIPGTVWQYAGRVALARAQRIPVRPVAISFFVELTSSAFAAGVLCLLLLGHWGAVAAGILVGSVIFATKRARDGALVRLGERVGGRETGRIVSAAATSLPLYVCVWLAVGTGFWLTARALIGTPASDVIFYLGAFTAAWLVGLIAIYAPGGLGVREAMLVVILRGKMGSADALVVAAASRAMLTVVDAGAALSGVLFLRRIRERRPDEELSSEFTRTGP